MNASAFASPSEIPGQKQKKLHQAAGQRLAATGVAAAFAASLAILACPVGGALAASSTVQVDVVNPATNAALTRSVDDPGRIPYESFQSIGAGQDTVLFPQVPAGHRLVIQHVSAGVFFQSVVNAHVEVLVTGGHGFSIFLAPFGQNLTGFDQLVQLYADAGDIPNVEFVADDGLTNVASGSLTLTGYLLDCAAAPCETIAH